MKYNSGFSEKSKIFLGKSKIFRILAIAIILALLMVAIPATPALAQDESIHVYPSRGQIGDDIAIYGYYFDAGERVYIYFSSYEADEGDDVDDLDAYEKVEDMYANVDGNIDGSFEVPDELTAGEEEEVVRGGDYYVYATYTREGEIVAYDEFTVIAIELDPEEGNVGDEIEISGAGFKVNRDIIIEYDGDEVDIESGNETTDSDGEFTCAIIIPESTAGDHAISVKAYYEAEAEFSVEPEITISPASGLIGDPVAVSGTGFSKRKDVTIYFNDVIMTLTSGTAETDRDGSFENLEFNVPVVGAGTYNVKAEDEADNSDTAVFAIATNVSLAPVTSLDSPGHIGMELTVSGTGFIANHQVTITYLSEPITVATTTADATGAFSATFDVPVSAGGTHTITATDGTNTKQDTFIMESTPPSPVYLVLPALGSKLEAWKFDWCGDAIDPSREVTDDSLPVTYTLEVATDAGFANVVLTKEGLTTSECTLTGEEKQLLPSTKKEAPYYWHVKAIDGASNKTDWTDTRTFYVGFAFTMPQWVIYTLFGVGALLLGLLGFWLGRRSAYSYF